MRARPSRSAHRTAQLAARAAEMRWAPTPSEARLWEALRGRQLGVGFRRQVVIAGYIVDFAASEARLVVEVDGGWHAGRERAGGVNAGVEHRGRVPEGRADPDDCIMEIPPSS